MGDPVNREKPQLHYAVSVPARTEATGGATRPAWEGTERGCWILSPRRSSLGVRGCRVSCPSPPSVTFIETRLHLRMGAPTPEARVPLPRAVGTAFGARSRAGLQPRWPGLRNGAPGAEPTSAHSAFQQICCKSENRTGREAGLLPDRSVWRAELTLRRKCCGALSGAARLLLGKKGCAFPSESVAERSL